MPRFIAIEVSPATVVQTDAGMGRKVIIVRTTLIDPASFFFSITDSAMNTMTMDQDKRT
jgi:hypothetical protein